MPGPAIFLPFLAVGSALCLALVADARTYRPAAILQHAARRLPALARLHKVAPLLRSPSYLDHARREGGGDLLFFLSHRSYLAQGLTARARIDAAHLHYTHLDHHTPRPLRDAILAPGGLTLWQTERQGHHFAVRVTRGRDVAHEGGLSCALEIDGGTLSVMSFSLVPVALLQVAAGTGVDGRAVFVTRKQTSRDEAARKAFDKAFDRCNPAGMTFAGLSALAMARGHRHVMGIAAESHPSWLPESAAHFHNSYSGFWETLGGQPDGPFAWRIDLPAHYADTEDMTAARRARALKRRAHIDAVSQSATAVLGRLLPAGNRQA